MIGASSAAGGTGLAAAGFPPLMACSEGLTLMGFAAAALAAVLTDLPTLPMSRTSCCRLLQPRLQCSAAGRYDPAARLLRCRSAPYRGSENPSRRAVTAASPNGVLLSTPRRGR